MNIETGVARLDLETDVSRDLAMGLLFSGLVDDFRGDQVATFCNQMAAYLIRKYDISSKGTQGEAAHGDR